MNDSRLIPDAEARAKALNSARSFIVQAPAGSGKTGLLIQRYLTLLARVDAPEEILAITFTRKAAAEMRNRVLAALASGESAATPELPHERHTRELAKAAHARDAAAGWQIAANPNRLRIQTIDTLCAALTRQMPVLARFGAQPETIEDASALYEEAAQRTLAELDAGGMTGERVACLLAYLDNNFETAVRLLADMLARRDQWLRHVADRRSPRLARAQLEGALANLCHDALDSLASLFPREPAEEVLALVNYAADNLAASGKESPISACRGLKALPGNKLEDLYAWRGLAELLLTKEGTLRQQVDVRLGFAPGKTKAEKEASAAIKQRFEPLVASLATHRTLIEELHRTRALPPATYSDAQWNVMEALTGLLLLAVGKLKLLFGERGQADFTEIAQAAVQALGEADAPTDLALALDHRIRHLLVDEFQDTSLAQFELLERLTAGWQGDDGRTLFVVGDPMQSIYRFRQAEVGLFLQARHHGIGSVPLEPITLSANFRSQQGLVDWCNKTFAQVMPDEEDFAGGAVPFVHSEAVHAALPSAAVNLHPQLVLDRTAEATQVTQLVQSARAENPGQTIAILVRSRTHLAEIVPRLKEAGLSFQAIEIEELGHRPAMQDLLALTRALVHPADRIAWLSILRAPWCGLTLADLDALAGHHHNAALWSLMQEEKVLARLSADGRQRLLRVRAVLNASLLRRRRESLRRAIEGAWLALGGPACAEDETDIEDARVFFKLLDELDDGGDLADFEMLQERVTKLYALPDTKADARLQLMTIHKAKGLEFDTVIVPGLGYRPRREDPRLLLWLEHPRQAQRRLSVTDLLLAPVREASKTDDPIYGYISLLDKAKGVNEDARLLYVAVTRAKSRLHLIGHVKLGKKSRPASTSLLERLWPAVQGEFEKAAQSQDTVRTEPVEVQTNSDAVEGEPASIRRFVSDWQPPAPPGGLVWKPKAEAVYEECRPHDEVEFSWASETAKHAGTVAHWFLQSIAEEGLDKWNAARVETLRKVFARDLAVLGVPETERQNAIARVADALNRSLDDERGRWVLSSHTDAQSELRLTGIVEGDIVNVVLDRTFVDERGVRWIVDYKTGTHEGADVEGFLNREQERYRKQLEQYAALMRTSDNREIRLGLYFPLLKGWREWEYKC